ncbi:hypothetical protein HDU96_008196 [Phlyctochytrium bullatum]|nr:hypothetical protein HDU96_008196 [Phlyctochytrium bullatum]
MLGVSLIQLTVNVTARYAGSFAMYFMELAIVASFQTAKNGAIFTRSNLRPEELAALRQSITVVLFQYCYKIIRLEDMFASGNYSARGSVYPVDAFIYLMFERLSPRISRVLVWLQMHKRRRKHLVDIEKESPELHSDGSKAEIPLPTANASVPVLPTYHSQARSDRGPAPYTTKLGKEMSNMIPAYEILARLEEARSNGSLTIWNSSESIQKSQPALSSGNGDVEEMGPTGLHSNGPKEEAAAVPERGVAGSTSSAPLTPYLSSLSPAAYALLRNDHAFISSLSTIMACVASVHLGWTLSPSDPTLYPRPSAATWLPPVVAGCAAYMIAGAILEGMLVVVESWWGVPVGINRKRPAAYRYLLGASFGVAFWTMLCGEGKVFGLVNEV